MSNMAKVQFSDVVPPDRRSIRNIPIPNSGKRKAPVIIKPEVAPIEKMDYVHEPIETPSVNDFVGPKNVKETKAYEYYYPKEEKKSKIPNSDYNQEGRSNKKKFVFGGVAILAIGVFLVAMMTIFSSATVTVTPKTQALEVSMGILGTVDATEESVRYEVIKVSKSQTASVPATGEESVKREAKGKIVIYNNFSAEPQRLIVRTRFESPEGLIYRIPESIMVPGKTATGPGSIEVEVVADEPGEKYNIKKTDFTVPGFKSDPERYKAFYARSVTDMNGGFVGKMKTVLPAEKQTALDKIESEVKSALEQELKSKVPDGLTFLSNSVIFESKEIPQIDESSSVVIGKEVTAYVVLLNSADLSNKIINQYSPNFPEWANTMASIQDFSQLQVTNKPGKIAAGDKINLEVVGKTSLVAEINTDLVGQRLVGVPRKEVTKLMDEFVGISSITVTIRPVWKQSFPENPLKIKVKTVGAP